MLERRKKKKSDFDKISATAKNKIEVDLKHQNKKGEADYLELSELDVLTLKFHITEDAYGLVTKMIQFLAEFLSVNNEYVYIKSLEDKIKAKRQKPNAADSKVDISTLDMATEREMALKALVSELPEALKAIVRDRVNAALDSPPDFSTP